MQDRRDIALIFATLMMLASTATAQIVSPAPAETWVGTNASVSTSPKTSINSASWLDARRWSYQVGIGFIMKSSVDDLLATGGDRAEGPSGGEIYLVQVSYKAAEFNPELWGCHIP